MLATPVPRRSACYPGKMSPRVARPSAPRDRVSRIERACPRWTHRATAALAEAGARVRVIAGTTPQNLRHELSRLEEAWRSAGAVEPRFAYEPAPDHGPLRRHLDVLASELGTEGELGAIYAGRALELGDDASLCEAAGTPTLWALARRRYARRDRFDADADATADAWLSERAPETSAPDAEVRSDDERSPASLVSRLRQEIGQRRLPLRVVVRDNLASLAATGDGFVQVIAGRPLTRRDVERTVLHEMAGHVEPRVL